MVRRRGVVFRISTFQPGGLGSIQGGVSNFNSYPGTGYVLYCVLSGDGPNILLTKDFRETCTCSGPQSVIPPTSIWPTGICNISPGGGRKYCIGVG